VTAEAKRQAAAALEGEMRTSPEALLAYLDELGIAAETVGHAPVFSVEESKELRGVIPGAHCKSLFLKDKKDNLLLVMALEHTRPDLKRLGEALGVGRLSFGSAGLLWESLSVKPGSVTPFALINDTGTRVRAVLEKALTERELVNFHPLSNDRSTTLSPPDLLRFLEATGHRPEILPLD
jgi:Ala-tRNA(Pro) deacylase